MSLINVSHLTFAYEGGLEKIFENVNFRIDTDWKLGFTGRNGRGKTTFLNLLLGRYDYEGSITSSVPFEYFPYPVPDDEMDAPAVIRTIAPAAEDWQIAREISLLDVTEDTLRRPLRTLSNGERTKTLLAALFLKENSFLLIDEPTNHLDLGARATVSAYLNRKRGFILVSHDRTFLDGCVDHILSINRANIEVQKGNFSSWWQNRQLLDESERAENERLKKDISRMQEAARRASGWSDTVEKTKRGVRNSSLRPDRGYIGHKAAKMAQRSKTLERRRKEALEEKSALLQNVEEGEKLKLFPLAFHSPRLAELENVSVSYGNRSVCEGVSFTIGRGERIALRGRNGCGKSSILKLILGERLEYGGTLNVASGLKISWLPQDAEGLSGSLTDFAQQSGIDRSLFLAILRKLDFSRTQFEKNMEDYSGGQKKKVFLARSLCEQAHLYLWDEPLNYIDVISRMQITELLLEHGPTMVFVEHDRAFCDDVATRVVNL